jgi:hypothetical protein
MVVGCLALRAIEMCHLSYKSLWSYLFGTGENRRHSGEVIVSRTHCFGSVRITARCLRTNQFTMYQRLVSVFHKNAWTPVDVLTGLLGREACRRAIT